MQLGELGRGREPSPQQINVDTSYKTGLVIDRGCFPFLIFQFVHVHLLWCLAQLSFPSLDIQTYCSQWWKCLFFVLAGSHRFLLVVNGPVTMAEQHKANEHCILKPLHFSLSMFGHLLTEMFRLILKEAVQKYCNIAVLTLMTNTGVLQCLIYRFYNR